MKKRASIILLIHACALMVLAAGPAGVDERGIFPSQAGERGPTAEGEEAIGEEEPLEERKYRQGGLVICVRRMGEVRGEGVDFEIIADNLNAARKTLYGRICLFDRRIKQPGCGSGEGAVFIEMQAKSQRKVKIRVRMKSFYSAWTLVIDKIYDF